MRKINRIFTQSDSDSFVAHMCARAECDLRGPETWERDLLAALAWIAQETHVVHTWSPERLRENVSITLPAIPGLWDRPRVLLAPAAAADPVSQAAVIAHECQHVYQLRHRYVDSLWPAPLAYIYLYGTSDEARAASEAEASGCDVAVDAWLTGRDPNAIASERLASLEGAGYGHLGVGDLKLAADLMRSYAATVGSGISPPMRSAHEAMDWLKNNGLFS